MDALKRSMRWDEEAFGREYDLDIFMIVAVSDFNMGAMENKGLNIFNDKYVLASPETATDDDFASIEAIIAHEYFHNWTGNRITCRDWFQLCLKEGLTVFRDQEFTSDQRSRPVKRIADVRVLRAHQFVEDAGPLAHPVRPEVYREINNFYTATVYEKGAEVVRMLKTLLGPDGFRNGMDLYFERHDGQAATVERVHRRASPTRPARDLTQFMRWYRQAGTPEVAVTRAPRRQAQTYTLEIAQIVPPTPGQPIKEPMVIPLAVGLVGAGRPRPAARARRRQRGRARRDRADASRPRPSSSPASTRAPVPSLNRGFSAPIKLTANLIGRRSALPRRARQRSVQPLAGGADARHRRCSSTMSEPIARRRQPCARTTGLIDALAAILADAALEPAFVAQALACRRKADIAREIGRDVDPDAIFAARSALRCAIGIRLGPALRDTYRRLCASASPTARTPRAPAGAR